MSELAVLGGTPVRTRSFAPRPWIDAEEIRLVNNVLASGRLSGFVGSATEDVERQILMTSEELKTLKAEWSYLGGPFVRTFCSDFSRMFNVKYSMAVNSASSGLVAALQALGIGPGDEVIVPVISWSASVTAVVAVGATPVLVDVDPGNACISLGQVELAMSSRTAAVLPVHLAGNMVDIAELRVAHPSTFIVEDAAQAMGSQRRGAQAGTLGNCGVFSLQESKNITAGEGGVVVTNDAELAARVRRVSNHGENLGYTGADDFNSLLWGHNFRMTELGAAVAQAQLAKLERANAQRVMNVRSLNEALSSVEGINPLPAHALRNECEEFIPHFLFALLDTEELGIDKAVFAEALRAEGIPVGTGYSRLLSDIPAIRRRSRCIGGPLTAAGGSSDAGETFANAQDVMLERGLWFHQIAAPYGREDMLDVACAIEKLLRNIEFLREYGREVS